MKRQLIATGSPKQQLVVVCTWSVLGPLNLSEVSLNLFQGGNIIRVLRRKMFIIFRISHELLKYQLLNSLNYKDVLFLKTCVQYLSSMGTFRTALLVTVFLLLINIFSGVVNDTPNTNNGGNEQEMILF